MGWEKVCVERASAKECRPIVGWQLEYDLL
jgi:hypothetical protein